MAEDRKYLIERIVNIDDVLIGYPPDKFFRDDDEDDTKSYRLELPLFTCFVNLDPYVTLSIGMVFVYNVKEREQRFVFQVTQSESGTDAVLRAKQLGCDNSPEDVRAERALQPVPLHPK